MKKSYLLLFAVGLSGLTFGQKKIVAKKPNSTSLSVDLSTVKSDQNLAVKAEGDLLFPAETFNGSANGWTTSGDDGAFWLFDTNGPDGQYSSTSNADILTSTTAANGFMIFDADLSNTPGTPATFVNRQGSLVSPVYDLTGQTNVSIRFQQAYRTCCSADFIPKLEVSTDGFVTFTTFDVSETGVGVNDFSGSVVKDVNINGYLMSATNLNNFQMRFNFDGVNGSSSHYFWQIDDIEIYEPYSYSLKALLPYWGTTGFWGPRLPYTMVPIDQIAPVDFSLIVENKGSVAQNDIILNTSIPEGPYTDASAASTINAFSFDTLSVSTMFTPSAALGIYNPTFNVTSGNTDAEPLDNALVGQPIQITQSVYARDLGVVDGSSSNQGEGFEVGNIFDMFANATVNSGSVFIRSTSNVGAQIYLKLYDLDPITRDFRYMGESPAYTLTTADLGTMITLTLDESFNLLADSSYLLVVGSFGDGGSTNDLMVATSGTSEAQTSYYYDMTDATWYYTTGTPMVRLNTGIAPTISSNDTDNNICSGETVVLTSDATTGNVWSNGETTQSINVTEAGTYSVAVNGLPSNNIVITVTSFTNVASANNSTVSTNQTGATYQWVDCGNGNTIIDGATSASYEASVNGSYACIATIGTCSNTSNCVVVNNVSVLNNENVSSIAFYPNPAKDNVSITFELKNETTVNVLITDLAGKEISSSNLGTKTGKNTFNINTNRFANGIYVVNFITENGVVTEKLFINK